MAISKRLRYEILKRDGYTCRYCGGRSPKVHLTIDHVVASTLENEMGAATLFDEVGA